MKRVFFLVAAAMLLSIHAYTQFASVHTTNGLDKMPSPAPQPAAYTESISKAALLFTENKGQVADVSGNLRPDILFTAHSGGAKIFLTATGIHYQFTKTVYPEGYDPANRKAGMEGMERQHEMEKNIQTQTCRFTVELQGASPQPKVITEERSSYTENFYLAHCPDGITGVHTYSRLVYKNVYPGIDWIIYSNGKGMKYDFVLQPGADPSLIRLQIKDAESVSISGEGELLIKTSLGEVQEDAPVSFAGDRKVSSKFKQRANGIIGFEVEKSSTDILTIDPAITWATYYGGSGWDYGRSCATDGNNNVYLAGQTISTSGIASGGFQDTLGFDNDAFLVKFSSTGNRLWATYYGGSSFDEGNSCTVDGNDNIYLAGITVSATGIASGGFQNVFGGAGVVEGFGDAFLVKFDAMGVRLWATYYGGSDPDWGFSCTTDGSNNVYLAGYTVSTTGIASGGFQNVYGGGTDAFLAKFNSAGGRLWATYYGGNGQEYNSTSCATDGSDNVYLAGMTKSISCIASAGFQNIHGGNWDAFLVKFSSAGTRVWATYYGGSYNEHVYSSSCATDGSDNVYIAGNTYSASDIASGGFQNVHGGGSSDAFLVKFDASGSRLWATYYGGSHSDGSSSCAVDGAGNVYLAGGTQSTTSIASGGFQNVYGGNGDAFLVKFNSSGDRLWATYCGGGDSDGGSSCAIDGNGNVYLAGSTRSTTGIASGGFQNVIGGIYDAFLAKIDGSGSSSVHPVFNNDALSSIIVYPNPCQGQFTIQLDTKTGEPLTIEVYNQLGQKMYSQKENAGSKSFIKKIVLQDAAPGMYYVQVRTGTNTYSSKLVLLK